MCEINVEILQLYLCHFKTFGSFNVQSSRHH